jgi:hypothetical protein
VAGVELWRSFAAASAVVERRQASALRSARAAPKRGSWTTRLSAFRLPSFFLGFAGLDRDERPDSTAGFALRSLESRYFVPLSYRLPHTSDADRIARTMVLGLAGGRFRTWRRTLVSPERIRLSLLGKLVWWEGSTILPA